MLRVVICRPSHKPMLQDLEDVGHGFRSIVGGSYERVPVSALLRTRVRQSLMLICLEDAFGRGLPMNQFGIVGTFIWVRVQGDHYMSLDFHDVVEVDRILKENPPIKEFNR